MDRTEIAAAFASPTVGKEGHWLDTLAMAQLKQAVLAKQYSVVLSHVEYTITYNLVRKNKVTQSEEYIVLKRADGGFVPYAEISMKQIMNFRLEGS